MRPSHNLESLLAPLQRFAGAEELCINRPNEVWAWFGGGFVRHEVAFDADDIIDLAHVAMAQRRTDAGPGSPLPGTDLLIDGELLRFQAILPPCVRDGYPAVAIRRMTEEDTTIDALAASGLFQRTRRAKAGPSEADRELIALYRAEDWRAFLKACVKYRKTIVLAGENGTGKSHVGRALLREVPLHERLNTISDSDELSKLPHQNAVHSFYAKDGGSHRPNALRLVEAHLRMRIGRPVINEIRDGDGAVAMLRLGATGHRGGITTMHAGGARKALDTLRIMLRQTEDGRSVSDQDIRDQLRNSIDVIIHTDRTPEDGFGMPEVYFATAEEDA